MGKDTTLSTLVVVVAESVVVVTAANGHYGGHNVNHNLHGQSGVVVRQSFSLEVPPPVILFQCEL